MVRPYKTRTAFTNLSSSPPTIYLNEYLIDDEAVAEYLILRELIHKVQHVPFEVHRRPVLHREVQQHSALFMPREKVEKIREKMEKRSIEVNRGLQ